MSDSDAFVLATAEDVTNALAFALRFSGRTRVHSADELMSSIVAKRLVEHLERSGFVVMKRRRSAAARRPTEAKRRRESRSKHSARRGTWLIRPHIRYVWAS